MKQILLFIITASQLLSFADSFSVVNSRAESRRALAPGICSVALNESPHSTKNFMSSFPRRKFVGDVLLTSFFISSAQTVLAKPTKATSEETIDSWKQLVAARDLLKSADGLIEKKDWNAILTLLDKDVFKNMESSLLKLVNGPILNQDDKKTIGTRKRYGIAADVLYGIGGVQAAIAAISDPQLQSCSAGVCSGKFVEADVEVPKSLTSLAASINEILNICKSYKEFI